MPLDQEAVSVPVGRPASAPEPADSRASQTPDSPTPALDHLTPPIDIYESPEGLILEADLPGVPEHHVSIQLEENVLNFRGRVVSTLPEGAKVLHEEYRAGDFGRSFILSDEVDRTQIAASLRNGVLRIILPRAERVRTRKIEIKTT